MAKLSGPEEFFEVFRHQKRTDRPDAPHEQPAQAPGQAAQPENARTELSFPAGQVSAEKIVPVKVSTLVFAAVCAVLLMILSFFAGVATRPDPAKDQIKQPGLTGRAGLTPGENRPITPSSGEPVTGGWELQVVSYAKNPANRKNASDWAQYFNEIPVMKASMVRAFIRESSTHVSVVVGPFQSPQSAAALKVRAAIADVTVQAGRSSAIEKPFRDALFVKAPEGR